MYATAFEGSINLWFMGAPDPCRRMVCSLGGEQSAGGAFILVMVYASGETYFVLFITVPVGQM